MDNLLESKLLSEFTFGFELEGFWNGIIDEGEIQEYFDKWFPDGEVQEDGSVRDPDCNTYNIYGSLLTGPDDSEEEDYNYPNVTSFEWASPILKFTPDTIKKVISLLSDGSGDWYTNDKCGMHHHISYPGITTEEMIWIMCHLSVDEKMVDEISGFRNFEFVSGWSNIDYLIRLKEYVETMNMQQILKTVDTDKYSLINVHSHKTLEWRGPRDFLNDDRFNKSVLTQFYKKLWSFVQWIAKTLDKKELMGVDKQTFFKWVRKTYKETNISNPHGWDVPMERGEPSYTSISNILSNARQKPQLLIQLLNNGTIEKHFKLFDRHQISELLRIAKYDDELPKPIIHKLALMFFEKAPVETYKFLEIEDIEKITNDQMVKLVNLVWSQDFKKFISEYYKIIPFQNFTPELNKDICYLTDCKFISVIGPYITVTDTIAAIINNVFDLGFRHGKDIDIKVLNDIMNLCKKNKYWQACQEQLQMKIYKLVVKNPIYANLIDKIDSTMLEYILLILYHKHPQQYENFKQTLVGMGITTQEEIDRLENVNKVTYKSMFDDEI